MNTFSTRIRWAAAAALLLAACAPAAAPTSAPVPTAEPQIIEVTRVVAGTPEVQVITATPPPAAPAETFRVAIVMPSSTTDMAFSQSMYEGLLAVQREMGGEGAMEIA